MFLPQMYIAHRQPVQKDSLFKALIVKLQTLFQEPIKTLNIDQITKRFQ